MKTRVGFVGANQTDKLRPPAIFYLEPNLEKS